MAYAVGSVPAGVERITRLEMKWKVGEKPRRSFAFFSPWFGMDPADNLNLIQPVNPWSGGAWSMYTEYFQWSPTHNSNSDQVSVESGQELHGSLVYSALYDGYNLTQTVTDTGESSSQTVKCQDGKKFTVPYVVYEKAFPCRDYPPDEIVTFYDIVAECDGKDCSKDIMWSAKNFDGQHCDMTAHIANDNANISITWDTKATSFVDGMSQRQLVEMNRRGWATALPMPPLDDNNDVDDNSNNHVTNDNDNNNGVELATSRDAASKMPAKCYLHPICMVLDTEGICCSATCQKWAADCYPSAQTYCCTEFFADKSNTCGADGPTTWNAGCPALPTTTPSPSSDDVEAAQPLPLARPLVPRTSALAAGDDAVAGVSAAGNDAYLTLATFDDGKKWVEENDPVMGGVSTNCTFTVDAASNSAVFEGQVENVPSLKAPGFCFARTAFTTRFSYGDASGYSHLEIVLTNTGPMYMGFKAAFAADVVSAQFQSFKADFNTTLSDQPQVVSIPFSAFSKKWDPSTGEPSSHVPPTERNLKDISQLQLWAEGSAGPFHVTIHEFRAANP